jgi:hypothetical protein
MTIEELAAGSGEPLALLCGDGKTYYQTQTRVKQLRKLGMRVASLAGSALCIKCGDSPFRRWITDSKT